MQMIVQPHLHTDIVKGCAATAETGNIKVTTELAALWQLCCGK